MGTLLATAPVHAATVRGRVDATFTATSTLHDIDGRAAGVDVTRPMTARVGRWQQGDDQLALHADLDGSLGAFGLAPPRTLFMRVGDTVHVRVDVRLRRE